MVISVDTGNKMIKTEHYEFNSGIDVLDTIPGENDEVIEFGGKYYRTTNRRIPVEYVKFQNREQN